MSHQAPWASMAMYLMQIPGLGVVTSMTVLAAIGDIDRFETPKHLVSYAGLAPAIEQSGTKQRAKPITKEGRKELRWAMVEVAWRAVRADPVWKGRFEELKRRKHANDANSPVDVPAFYVPAPGEFPYPWGMTFCNVAGGMRLCKITGADRAGARG
jgi:hypothetical protein